MPHTIVVIEDDVSVREKITKLLELKGYHVISLPGEGNVVAQIEIHKPDLVICDILLRHINGSDILSKLKSGTSDTIPFIFLVGKIEKESMRRGIELGADDFLILPLREKELISAVISRFELRKESNGKHLCENRKENVVDEVEPLNYNASIFIDRDQSLTLLKISEIVMIKSQRDYSKIIASGNRIYTIKKSMKNWETILPKEKFLRIHRSTIINTDYVLRFEKWLNYTYKVTMKELNYEVFVSQRYSRGLRSQLRG
jgi:DNA-binding LytR/AlgR family response regulator